MAHIVFDFDGTIADSIDFFIDFLAKEARLGHLDQARRDSVYGLTLPNVAHKLGHPWRRIPGLFFEGRRKLGDSIEDIRIFPGAAETLRKLAANGHHLFIVSSNSVPNIQKFLAQHDLLDLFEDIVGNVVIFKAPALRRLLRKYHIDKTQCWYVGDEIRDIQAAHVIGISSVAVSWGFAHENDLLDQHPTCIAKKPAEIMEMITKNEA
jgi:phosphoglycolate phosphatase